MNELAQGFIRAVERAVVIGDGKNSDDDDKITEIKSIAEETLAQLFDTQEISVDGEFDSTVLENLVKGIDKLAANTTPILVTSKPLLVNLKWLRMAKNATLTHNHSHQFHKQGMSLLVTKYMSMTGWKMRLTQLSHLLTRLIR